MRSIERTDCPNCWGYQTYENNAIAQDFCENLEQ